MKRVGFYRMSLVWTLLATLFVFPLTAYAAYDGWGAASYADKYWKYYNGQYPKFTSDCTNFVSQAMYEGGGIPFDKDGIFSRDRWYCYWDGGGWRYVPPWTVAHDLLKWILNDNHGSDRGSWGYPQPNTTTIARGDIISYDFYDDGKMNHSSIVVAWGTDTVPVSDWTGDLIDAHTSDHYHAIWHLRPYNKRARDTRVYAVRPY